MANEIKMIRTDPETINLLSKIKGWHLLNKENNISYATIVKNLVYKEAKRKGLTKNDGGKKDAQRGTNHT